MSFACRLDVLVDLFRKDLIIDHTYTEIFLSPCSGAYREGVVCCFRCNATAMSCRQLVNRSRYRREIYRASRYRQKLERVRIWLLLYALADPRDSISGSKRSLLDNPETPALRRADANLTS